MNARHAEVHATPADVERRLPLGAVVGDEAATTADAGVVEQQVDVVGVVLGDHGVAERVQLCLVGDVGHERRDPGAGGRVGQGQRLVSAMSSADTSQIATWQPSALSWRASSRPMPVPPPVTTAIRPSKCSMATDCQVSGGAVGPERPGCQTRPMARAIRHVAFLGGINVGGHRVTMERLRDEVTRLGFPDVSTFIASGNVMFSAPPRPDHDEHLAQGLEAALGWPVPTFVRTARRAHGRRSTCSRSARSRRVTRT